MDRKIFKQFENVEEEFYEIDKENKIAHVNLKYHTPNEIFDEHIESKTPLFTYEFSDWLSSTFSCVPNKYKIEFDVSFDSMEGYTDEKLNDIFNKNIYLFEKSDGRRAHFRNRIAVSLFIMGIISFILMLMTKKFWVTQDFWHEAFFYILDIMTTVLFWEAAGILIVENRERTSRQVNYLNRFHAIHFHENN